MQSTVSGRHPLRLTASRVLVVLLLSVCWPLAAKPVERSLKDKEKYTAQVSGDRGTLQLHLDDTLSGADAPTISVVNDDNYVWWSAPLTDAGGGNWTAPLEPKAVEALLVGTKVVAKFPKAAKGDDLTVTAAVSDVRPVLADAGSLMKGTTPFFKAPTEPDQPDVPSMDTNVSGVTDFVSAATNWDRRMTAYQYDYAAAASRARALWMDLVTANRVPWVKDIKSAGTLASLDNQKDKFDQDRQQFRQKALAFVEQWNNTHAKGGVPPVVLKFDQAAA